jgi:hypothetical protein
MIGGIQMKRTIAALCAILLLALTITGCGSNGLEDYKKAAEKTGEIKSGQRSGQWNLTMDFDTVGMTQEEITDLNYYQNISGKCRTAFNKDRKQSISREYLNLGGLGFDFELYQNNGETVVKLPIAGKYVKLDELMKQAAESTGSEVKIGQDKETKFLSDDTVKALSREWLGILDKDDVFKGKDIVITTPDGEVKTTVYTITLNDGQVKTLAQSSINILSKDESLKKTVETMTKEKKAISTDEFDKLLLKGKEWIGKYEVEKFRYTAHVDINGSIVNETMEFQLKNDSAAKGVPKNIAFKLDLKNWDINQYQKLEFPILTEENTLRSDDMNQTMPFVFKNLFPKKQ